MQVQVTTFAADQSATTIVAKALLYTFPKKGNAADDYTLLVNGEVLGAGNVATTGGGKYPAYTSFKYNGTSYYLPKSVGALPSGSKIDVVVEAPKAAPAPVEPAPAVETPAEVEAPKPPKAPRAPRAPKK